MYITEKVQTRGPPAQALISHQDELEQHLQLALLFLNDNFMHCNLYALKLSMGSHTFMYSVLCRTGRTLKPLVI